MYGAFFVKKFARGGKSLVLRQFLCSISKPVSSSRPRALTSSRAGAVKVGRRPNVAACSELTRPYLDSFEHDDTLGAIGMTIRGEPACGRGISRATTLYPVGPRTRTMMQSYASAAKLRSGGPILLFGIESQGNTSGFRHLEPSSATRHQRTERAETVGCPSVTSVMMPAAEQRRPAPHPPARDATGRSAACAPRPRSWSCACRGRSRCGLETTAPRRCPSGT